MANNKKNTNFQNSESDQTNSNDRLHFLKELSVRLTRSTRIRVATFIIIMTSAVSVTWMVAEIFSVNPKVNELEEMNANYDQLKSTHQELVRENITLNASYLELRRSEKIPIVIYPVNRRPIIGRHLTFHWKYDVDPGFQNLVLELIKTNDGKVSKRRFQIPEPGRKTMFFEFPMQASGDFFWRIGTGELLNDQDGTRLWSRFGSFSLYPSVIDKIKATKELVVGTAATFLSYDHPVSPEGRPDSYDMDLIEWISISDQLRKGIFPDIGEKPEIVVRLKYVKWEHIFSSVINGDVDLAIANITKCKSREDEYPGLRFTEGYRVNRQRLVKANKNVVRATNEDVVTQEKYKKEISDEELIRDILKNKTVGAQNKTINLEAANHLKNIFEFEVRACYSSYADVIHAVQKGDVDYGMIDSVRVETVYYPELEILNVDLDPYLKKFYRDTLGLDSERETYAIAVSGQAGNKEFIELLNKLITSPEGKAKRLDFENRHKYKEPTNGKQMVIGSGI